MPSGSGAPKQVGEDRSTATPGPAGSAGVAGSRRAQKLIGHPPGAIPEAKVWLANVTADLTVIDQQFADY